MLFNKKGFTLVEVLVVIGVIGIVAALTIPSLMASINNIVSKNQTKVIEAKLIQGLNLLNIEGNVNSQYASSYDFVQALSKYLKMVNICSSENIGDCIPYDYIVSKRKNNKQDLINVQNLKKGIDLHIEDNGFEDTAAFITADGIPFIISYNKNCISEDQNYRTVHPCVAGIYDLNGARGLNVFGEDIKSINGANVSKCFYESDTMCVTHGLFSPYPITKQRCEELQAQNYGIKNCFYDNDYWAGAVEFCGGTKHLPSRAQLSSFVPLVYTSRTIDVEKFKKYSYILGTPGIDSNIWSGEEYDENGQGTKYVWYRGFYFGNIKWPYENSHPRNAGNVSTLKTFCVE